MTDDELKAIKDRAKKADDLIDRIERYKCAADSLSSDSESVRLVLQRFKSLEVVKTERSFQLLKDNDCELVLQIRMAIIAVIRERITKLFEELQKL